MADLMASRWRGQRGRLEVWYTTLTDPATGTGVWLHHELVAPSDGAPAYAHGWATVFPPTGAPHFARFGPTGWAPTSKTSADGEPAGTAPADSAPASGTSTNGEPAQRAPAGRAPTSKAPADGGGSTDEGPAGTGPADGAPAGGVVFAAGPVEVSGGRLVGKAGDVSWDLSVASDGPPLFTFPRWAWERELLPAAQIVPAPVAAFTGTIRYGDRELALRRAPGGTARIFGHGNAQRWAWLHADLGDGDVLELVAAVSTRPGLRRLRPLPMVRLRLGGVDHPAGDPLLASWRLRADLALPTWRVSGRVGDHLLEVTVTQPPEQTVTVPYCNPDGTGAVCRNSERASADITWRPRSGGAPERHWRLDGTAHAEVGSRD